MTDRTVFVLVGLQAAGKTTLAHTLSGDSVVVSKDDFPNARRRQARQLRLIHAALAEARDVVVDNTNPSAEEWTPIIDVARAHGARVVAYFFAPDATGRCATRVRLPDRQREC